jgi:hypothetical protein
MLRRWAIVAAALIAIGGFEPFYYHILFVDRPRTSAILTELPFRKAPYLREFYVDVRARTRSGDSIAIASPFTKWDGGYEYVYVRSLYTLTGRHILPLLDPQDTPHPENLARANYVAAYRSEPRIPNFVTMWRGPHGSLLRRER